MFLVNMKSLFMILFSLLQFLNLRGVKANVVYDCNNAFGKPTLMSCLHTVRSFLSDHSDRRLHFLSISSVIRPPADVTRHQWRNRVNLPVIELGSNPGRKHSFVKPEVMMLLIRIYCY